MLRETVWHEWVDYPTAKRFSGLSHTTLWRYVSNGELKAARVGRSVRIHLPSLKTFMEERTGAAADKVAATSGGEEFAKEERSRA